MIKYKSGYIDTKEAFEFVIDYLKEDIKYSSVLGENTEKELKKAIHIFEILLESLIKINTPT